MKKICLLILCVLVSCSSEDKKPNHFIVNKGIGEFYLKQTEKSLLEMTNVSMMKKGDYKYYFYIEKSDTLYYTKNKRSIKNPIVDNITTTSEKIKTSNGIKVGMSVKSLRKLYADKFDKQIKNQNQAKKDLKNIVEQTGSNPIQFQHYFYLPEYSESSLRGMKELKLSLIEVEDSISRIKDTIVSKITLGYK